MLITLDQTEYKRLDVKSYALEKRRLQIELLKLQEDVIKNNRKICIVFEGRDTAGKSSAIKFFSIVIFSPMLSALPARCYSQFEQIK